MELNQASELVSDDGGALPMGPPGLDVLTGTSSVVVRRSVDVYATAGRRFEVADGTNGAVLFAVEEVSCFGCLAGGSALSVRSSGADAREVLTMLRPAACLRDAMQVFNANGEEVGQARVNAPFLAQPSVSVIDLDGREVLLTAIRAGDPEAIPAADSARESPGVHAGELGHRAELRLLRGRLSLRPAQRRFCDQAADARGRRQRRVRHGGRRRRAAQVPGGRAALDARAAAGIDAAARARQPGALHSAGAGAGGCC